MHAMPLAILEKWVEDGKFNPEWIAESDYSHCSHGYIGCFESKFTKGTALESVGIMGWSSASAQSHQLDR